MPSLQRGPAKSILTPGQIDGPSSRVCLGLAALTYVSTPRDLPIHISLRSPFSVFLYLPAPSSLFAKCYIRKNVKILANSTQSDNTNAIISQAQERLRSMEQTLFTDCETAAYC